VTGEAPGLLLLWDVDHTLLEAGPVGRAIYRIAFERLTGRVPQDGPRTDGRTDLAIMADLLARHGIDAEAVPGPRLLDALTEAARSLGDELVAGGQALPGAAECLALLRARPGIVQSVLTGNIEPNARLKLAAFGLDGDLDLAVGAYGSDSTVRADLVPVAQRKAADRYGFDPADGVTVLVGDTRRDVEAGRDGGARVLGVGTGRCTARELLDAGADAALDSLADTARVLAAIDALATAQSG
jgi:phosphoglycolate phosphatase-like HAD superfamily hydrolase